MPVIQPDQGQYLATRYVAKARLPIAQGSSWGAGPTTPGVGPIVAPVAAVEGSAWPPVSSWLGAGAVILGAAVGSSPAAATVRPAAVARAESPAPEAGAAAWRHGPTPAAPPMTPAAIVAPEAPRPPEGAALAWRGPTAAIVPAVSPGPVLVASAEPPRLEAGMALLGSTIELAAAPAYLRPAQPIGDGPRPEDGRTIARAHGFRETGTIIVPVQVVRPVEPAPTQIRPAEGQVIVGTHGFQETGNIVVPAAIVRPVEPLPTQIRPAEGAAILSTTWEFHAFPAWPLATLATGEGPRPEPGAAAVWPHGRQFSERNLAPAAYLVRAEESRPEVGSVASLAGLQPPPIATARPGVTARAEEPRPGEGSIVLDTTYQPIAAPQRVLPAPASGEAPRPEMGAAVFVPGSMSPLSLRPPWPATARGDDPRPEAGSVVLLQPVVRMPAAGSCLIASAETIPPPTGSIVLDTAPAIAPMPRAAGSGSAVATSEPPRPEAGGVFRWLAAQPTKPGVSRPVQPAAEAPAWLLGGVAWAAPPIRPAAVTTLIGPYVDPDAGTVLYASGQYVDPDAGTILDASGYAVDPGAGTLILAAGYEVDPDAGTAITVGGLPAPPEPPPQPPGVPMPLRFYLASSSDDDSPASGTPAVLIYACGGAQQWIVPVGSLTSEGFGWWRLDATAADLAGATPLLLHAAATDSDQAIATFFPAAPGGWLQNQTAYPFVFWLGSAASGGVVGAPGLAPQVLINLNGGGFQPGAGTVTEPGGAGNGHGYYLYWPTAADVAQAGTMLLFASDQTQVALPDTFPYGLS